MPTPVLGTLASGQKVIGRRNCHLHAGVKELLPEVLSQVSGDDQFVKQAVDLCRIVGLSNCVETTENDQIVFAQRVARSGLSRFALNRECEKTSQVTVVVQFSPSDRCYVMATAYCGPLAELEPWSPRVRKGKDRLKSYTFWGKHALVWGSEPIIPKTITNKYPW